MHVRCFDIYLESIESRHTNQYARNHPENIERKEFICPLCKSLGNVLLPIREDPEYSDNVVALPASLAEIERWAVALSADIASGWPQAGGIDLVRSVYSADSEGRYQIKGWSIVDELLTPLSSQVSGTSSTSSGLGEAERDLLQRVLHVAWPLSIEGHKTVGGRSIPEELIVYTLSCLEIASRGQASHTGQSAASTAITLKVARSLVTVCRDLVVVSFGSSQILRAATAAHSAGILAKGGKTIHHRHFATPAGCSSGNGHSGSYLTGTCAHHDVLWRTYQGSVSDWQLPGLRR